MEKKPLISAQDSCGSRTGRIRWTAHRYIRNHTRLRKLCWRSWESTRLSWDAAAAEPEYLTQWPDNAFTQKIPQPQSGTVDYVLDHSASGRYAIFCKDISAAESAQYVQALRDAGYTELQSAESSVSAGTIIARDDSYLSVSYADGVLGIVITLRKNAK